MAAELSEWINQVVSVITNDGRNIVGVFRGYDQSINVILAECHERVFSMDAPAELAELGLYVIRGDNIAVIGEIDEDADARIDYSKIRAEPLKAVVH